MGTTVTPLIAQLRIDDGRTVVRPRQIWRLAIGKTTTRRKKTTQLGGEKKERPGIAHGIARYRTNAQIEREQIKHHLENHTTYSETTKRTPQKRKGWKYNTKTRILTTRTKTQHA